MFQARQPISGQKSLADGWGFLAGSRGLGASEIEEGALGRVMCDGDELCAWRVWGHNVRGGMVMLMMVVMVMMVMMMMMMMKRKRKKRDRPSQLH